MPSGYVINEADSKEMNTFDNKGYVDDGNGNQVENGKNRKLSTKTRFANLNESEIRLAKRGIIKNVVIISFSFMLLFTAFQSMANLQSSINKVSTYICKKS